MRIPKAILGVISAYLHPQEIHVLTLLYKYDTTDVLKIAMIYGADYYTIITYPKWRTCVYYEIIHYMVLLSNVGENIHLTYYNCGCCGSDRNLLMKLPDAKAFLLGYRSKYMSNILRDLICRLLLCWSDYEFTDLYKMQVIGRVIAYMNQHMMWCISAQPSYNDIEIVHKCIIYTQNIHVLYYLCYNQYYEGTPKPTGKFEYTCRIMHMHMFEQHLGLSYENNNTKMYDVILAYFNPNKNYQLSYAWQHNYLKFASFLLNEYQFDDSDVGELLENLEIIENKKQYVNNIFYYFKYTKQQLIDILNSRHALLQNMNYGSRCKGSIMCLENEL